jgi:hypothetical protein
MGGLAKFVLLAQNHDSPDLSLSSKLDQEDIAVK